MACIVIALIATAGHVTGDLLLASWSDGRFVDMKQHSIAMLILAGAMAVLMTTAPVSKWRETAICTMASAIAGMIFTQVFWYARVPLLVDEEIMHVISPNMQSVGTIVALSLLSVSGWLRSVFENIWAAIVMSRVAGVIGAATLLGYAMGLPKLYWSYPEISNPMAIPTAVCLVLCAFAVNGRETI